MSTPDPLAPPFTDEELREVREDHEGTGKCYAIQAWPCHHARLLATLDARDAGVEMGLGVERLVAALETISSGRHPDGHRGAVQIARAALAGMRETSRVEGHTASEE